MNTTSTAKNSPSPSRTDDLVEALLKLSIDEDLGQEGDITTKATVPANLQAQCTILCKEQAVIAGLRIAQSIFTRFDKEIKVAVLVQEGTLVEAGNTNVATVQGPAGPILSAERLVLNLMQRMSGVATTTRKFVELARDSGIQILDTRKTTPGMRQLQREAV